MRSDPQIGRPRIRVAEQVAARFSAEVEAHPAVEVGGKYVGFIAGPGRHPDLRARKAALPGLVFNITDYLDDGPGAERSATFHRGDAAHQVQAFRELELRHPEIEHIGSWHSHHPNGLCELSGGDVRGYQETVDEAGHHHDFFVVSLGLDAKGFLTARHFLFLRGDDRYYEIPATMIELVPESLAHTMRPQRPVLAAERRPPDSTPEAVPQEAAPHVPGWTDTEGGRRALAWERELASRKQFSGVRLLVKEGRLVAKGAVLTNYGPVTVRLLYPSHAGGSDGLLKLTSADPPGMEITVGKEHASGLRHAWVVANELGRLVIQVGRVNRPEVPGWFSRLLRVSNRA